MELLPDIWEGFLVALTPTNILYAFVGVCMGTLVGVLPGLGAPACIALLLPLTFSMNPATAVIMLAGIYYGAMYGGSTTSILVNMPGEAGSVVTCLDGYELARKGRAGPALGMCAIASFVAGTVGVFGLMFLAAPLSRVALSLGPPEYVVLFVGGLGLAALLARGSKLKGFMMVLVGLIVGTVGIDQVSGHLRFTFGSTYLLGGVNFVVVAMGLFGVGEVLFNLENSLEGKMYTLRLSGLLPTRRDFVDARASIARGSVIGFLLGILPGGGAIMASFVSYGVEKKLSSRPEEFGTGVIEGVAGPEAANNSATAGAFIPLLTLGIPFNAVTALLLGALMIHGVRPGPLMMEQHPQLFWGVIASMYVGNVMLLVLNLPLIGIFVQLLRLPYSFLFPLILLFTVVGSYSVNNNVVDVFAVIFFGIFGYLMRKTGFEPAPFILALILSPMLETAFRQSLILSHGSLSIFVTRPVSGFSILILVTVLAISTVFKFASWRGQGASA